MAVSYMLPWAQLSLRHRILSRGTWPLPRVYPWALKAMQIVLACHNPSALLAGFAASVLHETSPTNPRNSRQTRTTSARGATIGAHQSVNLPVPRKTLHEYYLQTHHASYHPYKGLLARSKNMKLLAYAPYTRSFTSSTNRPTQVPNPRRSCLLQPPYIRFAHLLHSAQRYLNLLQNLYDYLRNYAGSHSGGSSIINSASALTDLQSLLRDTAPIDITSSLVRSCEHRFRLHEVRIALLSARLVMADVIPRLLPSLELPLSTTVRPNGKMKPPFVVFF
jgi:hypothetical protein